MAPALLIRRHVSGGLIGKLSCKQDETLARPDLEQRLDALRRRVRGRAIHLSPGRAFGRGGSSAESDGVCSIADAGLRVIADSAPIHAAALRQPLDPRGRACWGTCDGDVIAHAIEE